MRNEAISHSGILTIGHSNRPIGEFLDLLKAHHVELLVDVRTIPRSRHNPQFNKDALPGPLSQAGIDYLHMSGLGGLRKPRPDSTNTGWRNLSFRGYADFMQTPPFQEHLGELRRLASTRTLAVMCAESVPWRCHRSLIADALTAQGVEVRHIVSASPPEAHRLTAFAQVEGSRVWYPGEQLPLISEPQL